MPRHEMTRYDVLHHALAIARRYRNEHQMTLTLRQMYYRFVAEGLSPSGQLHYKRIGDVLTDARYSGTYPVELLEDRGRDVAKGDFTRWENDVSAALDYGAGWLQNLPSFLICRARWCGQPIHVSVWVEKQALEGVFQPTCDELGVSWFACKGYPSVSALWEWIQAAHAAQRTTAPEHNPYHFPNTDISWRERHKGAADRCVVLYFGDHDPDGWEIPRSAERNIRQLLDVKHMHLDVEFRRVALLREQIDRYNPPPFEAKVSSSRYQSYVDEHETDEAWELDALEPPVLRDLIRENVEALFDPAIARGHDEVVSELRAQMREQMLDPTWAAKALSDDSEGGD